LFLARPSVIYSSPQDYDDLLKCNRIVELALAERLLDFVRRNKLRPVVIVYGQDATSHKAALRRSIVASPGSELVGTRQKVAPQIFEYFAQRVFCLGLDDAVVLTPSGMATSNREIRTIAALMMEYMPQLERMGHRGIRIFAMLSDRGNYKSVADAHARVVRLRSSAPFDQAENPFHEYTSLILSIPCVLHNFGTAFRWGLLATDFFSNDVQDNCFSVVDGARWASRDLMLSLPRWLLTHLKFQNASVQTLFAMNSLWLVLGVDNDLRLELLALHLRFDGENVVLKEELQGCSKLIGGPRASSCDISPCVVPRGRATHIYFYIKSIFYYKHPI